MDGGKSLKKRAKLGPSKNYLYIRYSLGVHKKVLQNFRSIQKEFEPPPPPPDPDVAKKAFYSSRVNP